ncbi:unnamed protein product [Macrosiphum euphorbiae]|uniref:Uncharacterized protein n=1 Tax=Macrosiphum euphorbiae TaxID=13131 RepID=A0AAV0XWQ7_9HEMI|nr:unnamed protein product [Macrosiphum euphorbiae]
MFDGDNTLCSEVAMENTCRKRNAPNIAAQITVVSTKKAKTTSTAFTNIPLLQLRAAMASENLSVDNLVHVTQIFKDLKLQVGTQFHISVWIILISLWHPEHFATLMNPKKWLNTNLAQDVGLEECNMEETSMKESMRSMLLEARQFMSTHMSADNQTRLVGVYGCNDASSIANMDDDAFDDAFGLDASRRRTGKISYNIFLQTAGNPNKLTASVPMEDYVMDAILYKYIEQNYLRYVRNSYLKQVFISSMRKKNINLMSFNIKKYKS